MIKAGILFTHPASKNILSGVTRDLVLESALACKLSANESAFTVDALLNADEVWISSSTREIMPITQIDDQAVNRIAVFFFWWRIHGNKSGIIAFNSKITAKTGIVTGTGDNKVFIAKKMCQPIS
jgi:hypothetical protein